MKVLHETQFYVLPKVVYQRRWYRLDEYIRKLVREELDALSHS